MCRREQGAKSSRYDMRGSRKVRKGQEAIRDRTPQLCGNSINRLKAMETNSFAAAAGVPLQRLEFVYDSQSRRIRKVLEEWDAAQQTFSLKRDTRFLYDG